MTHRIRRGEERNPHLPLALAALFAFLFLLPASASYAAPGSASHHSSSEGQALTTEEIAKLALPSVVSITVLGKDGQVAKQGSGFVVADNIVATNFHVINGAHAATANFQNGRSEEVHGLVNWDQDHDIALLYVDTGGVRPLSLQTASSVPIGEPVVAVGSPEGLGGSISTGVVSAVRSAPNMKIIQTTAAISPGSSGGALIDPQGRVLGITSFFLKEGENLNFAYAAYYVKLLLPKRTPVYVSWAELESKYKDSWTTNEAEGGPGQTNPIPPPSGPSGSDASGGAVSDKPLSGLHGFYVVLEDLQDSATAAGLTTTDVQNDIEHQLRQAGITVLDQSDDALLKKDPTNAYLYVNINTLKDDSGLFAYNISVTLEELVRLQRGAPVQVQGGTWHNGGMGIVPSDNASDTVRSDVKEYVADFIKDYNAQNP